MVDARVVSSNAQREHTKMTNTMVTTPPLTPMLRAGGSSRLRSVVVGITAAIFGMTYPLTAGAVASHNVAINESSYAKVVVVTPGTHIALTLHSTYWTLAPLTPQKILAQQGPARTEAKLPASGNGCVPGQGCGTITAQFLATGAGQVRLRASRTSCGEALRCTERQSNWTVVIKVR